jgi:hypothetical protein
MAESTPPVEYEASKRAWHEPTIPLVEIHVALFNATNGHGMLSSGEF